VQALRPEAVARGAIAYSGYRTSFAWTVLRERFLQIIGNAPRSYLTTPDEGIARTCGAAVAYTKDWYETAIEFVELDDCAAMADCALALVWLLRLRDSIVGLGDEDAGMYYCRNSS